MSLMQRLKRLLNKQIDNLYPKEVSILPNTSKYKNMTLFAPDRGMNADTFYLSALDENNNPIVDETIKIKIDDEIIEKQTNEYGNVIFPLDLDLGLYVAEVFFPNGEYSQSIETNITRFTPEKTKRLTNNKKKNDEDPKKKVYLYTPNMTMYKNSETQYYAKLRNYEFEPVEGEKIKFTIDGKTYTSKTDEQGFAKVDIALDVGTYPVKIDYEGGFKYNSAHNKSKLEILLRDIDRKVMIDVNHLTMEFKVTNDKIDTLKEFIIRTIKRNKEEKEKIKILDDITFQVYEGEKLGILGFNGAGKSTLLKVITGIYEPTEGYIKKYGKIAPLLELGAGFDKNYTGKNNIYLNGAFLGLKESFIKEKYDEIVEYSELGEFINYPIKNYSSGMRAKLGFSIATLAEPDILIIDEILSVGDVKFKQKSSEKINSMMEDGVTVILVSHSISQIKKICNRCIWLEDGKIAMQGDVDAVCDAYLSSAAGTSKKNKK